MSPYRRSADVATPKTLADLFGQARDLSRDDGLSLRYRLLPWKRIVATIVYRPLSLSECLLGMAKKLEVAVDIVRDALLDKGQHRIVFWGAEPVLRGAEMSRKLKEIEGIEKAMVRAGRSRFAIEGVELHFSVTSYERKDLAPRFEAMCRWDELGLPPLLDRPWLRAHNG